MTEEARKQGGELGIRYASWLAWSVCALSLALTALSYFVIALDLSLNAPIYFYWLEPTTIAIGYSVIGAIIASRLPDHPIGWICCAIGLTGAVEHFRTSAPLRVASQTGPRKTRSAGPTPAPSRCSTISPARTTTSR